MLDHLFHYSAGFESQLSDLGSFMKQLSLVICGKASVGGCCTLRIMFTVKLKCGGSVMKRTEVKWTIPNSDFHVALQRKLIFFKVTCCLSLWLLRKLHLKLQHRKKKKIQLQWSVEQFGPDEKTSDRKPCESVLSLGICWHICAVVGLSGFTCQQNQSAFHVVEPLFFYL